ncbi:MAG: hypothetical protein WD894_15085 [Pirellulales bacterium]
MARSGSATREELIFAIEQLTEQVRLLGNIIDDLTSELQWQNRNATAPIPPPFMLTSLPADPTARDWRVNASSPQTVPQAEEPPVRNRPQSLFD